MAQTETELYNLAAQCLGSRGRLTSTVQASRAVDVFNLWYPIVRPVVLKAAHWPSATKTASLSLVTTRTDGSDWTDSSPTPGAAYAYRQPSDMIYPRYLSTYGHFELGMIGDEKCIFAHEASAILTYTFDQTNPGLWDPELFLTMAQALAAYTARTLTGKRSLQIDAQNEANAAIKQAQASAQNVDNHPVQTVASWHAARGYIGRPQGGRYVFPFGPLIAVGESANVK